MELDDLKLAWQQMDKELRTQRKITVALLADRNSANLADSLRPLFNWQVFQVILGVCLAGASAQFWLARLDQPLFFVSGVILHAYAIALIVNGARVLLRLKEIDYSAPVTLVQKRVARLEHSYVVSGWILGLPWWLLWIPVAIMLLTIIGVDLSRVPVGNWLPANIFVGVVGMILTVIGFRWASRSSRPGLKARMERMVRGASIENARRVLNDIERFEQETD